MLDLLVASHCPIFLISMIRQVIWPSPGTLPSFFELPSSCVRADSIGALRKLILQVSGCISVVMSIFSVFGLSYERSDNEF